MTLPSVIQNVREKIVVSKVKKAYSQLSQAYMQIKKDYGSPDEWGQISQDEDTSEEDYGGMYNSENHKLVARLFAKNMKVMTNCIGMNNDEVRAHCTKSMSLPTAYSSFRILDGTTIIFRSWYPECNKKFGTGAALSNICGSVHVDINASGGPDLEGQDIFSFYLTKEAIVPIGTAMDTTIAFDTHCTKNQQWGSMVGAFTNGNGCTGWVLYNENMDYLHCSDLSWDGKKKCK